MSSVLGWGTKVLHGKTQPKTNKQKSPQINRQNKEMKEGTFITDPIVMYAQLCPTLCDPTDRGAWRATARLKDLHWQADSSPLSHLGSPMDAPRSHPDEHRGTVPAPNHSAVGEDVTAELCWLLHKPNVPSFPGLACEAWSLLPTAQ